MLSGGAARSVTFAVIPGRHGASIGVCQPGRRCCPADTHRRTAASGPARQDIAPNAQHGRDRALIFISHSCKDALVAHPPAGFDADKLARLRFALQLHNQPVDRL